MLQPNKQTRCTMCKQKLSKIYRVNMDRKGLIIGKTKNSCLVCENKKCSLYINYDKVPSWVRPEAIKHIPFRGSELLSVAFY